MLDIKPIYKSMSQLELSTMNGHSAIGSHHFFPTFHQMSKACQATLHKEKGTSVENVPKVCGVYHVILSKRSIFCHGSKPVSSYVTLKESLKELFNSEILTSPWNACCRLHSSYNTTPIDLEMRYSIFNKLWTHWILYRISDACVKKGVLSRFNRFKQFNYIIEETKGLV